MRRSPPGSGSAAPCTCSRSARPPWPRRSPPRSTRSPAAGSSSAWASVGRGLDGFATAHLTFITVGRDYERARSAWVARLSKRYAQDFGPLADRYGVIGTPEQCAARLAEFRDAGCTYFLLNAICEPPNEREQLELIAAEVLPRLRR